MKSKNLFVAALLTSALSMANATPVKWSLDPAQSSYPFLQAYGTFTYDADFNLYSDVALRFTSFKSIFDINAGDANGFNYGTSNGSGIYTFVFATALTDAGGIVNGIMTEADDHSTHSFTVRTAAPAAPAATVPEPAESALLLVGMALIHVVRRRNPLRRSAVR